MLKNTFIKQNLFGLALATTSLLWIDAAFAAVSSPTITEASGGRGVPITVGNFDNVDAIGYEVHEYFVAGNAHAYYSDQKLTKDGKWNAIHAAGGTAPFKTRVIVYTPKDKTQFNGTVYIEWQNNSGLVDAAPDWVHGHVEVARQGAAYVLASVQPIGISTLKATNPWWLPVPADVDISASDPARYQSLHHPGNKYNYDMFSQIAQAAREGTLLGSMIPERIIGLGESQSSFWVTTYINAVQQLEGVFDGFVAHSSFGVGMPLGTQPNGSPGATHIRDDLVPVILFQSETDVQLGAMMTRQNESPESKFRLWEVAGTSHYDLYGLDIGLTDAGNGQGEATAFVYLKDPIKVAEYGIMQCAKGVNDGAMHWVYSAALDWINRWVKDGTAPPIAPRIETDDSLVFIPKILTDEHGNARGGIRTPFVDVPVATLAGFGNGAAEGANAISSFCGIFGQTVPFSDEKLATLYSSNDDFVAKFSASAQQAVDAGFLLPTDAARLIDAAENADVMGD